MPIKILENQKGKLILKPSVFSTKAINGFWNCLEAGDFNKDGAIDFVLGNHGENTRLKAAESTPITMHVNDFDKNRTAEQIISIFNEGTSYPLPLRHDLVMQLPGLKKKYLLYENYKGQQIDDIFEEKQVRTSAFSKVHTTASSLAINNGEGNFTLVPLPIAAQLSPVYAILVEDFNKDGNLDLLLGGNYYRSKPEIGIYDASYGLLLTGNGKGNFRALTAQESGFLVKGEIRDFTNLTIDNKEVFLVCRNDEELIFYKKRNYSE